MAPTPSTEAALLRRVEAYYSRKIVRHGPTPAGVDWADPAAQELRFRQLLKVCDFSRPMSLNDLGCGYGALLTHIRRNHPNLQFDYLGIDVSPAMIWHAQRDAGSLTSCRFLVGHRIPRQADYTVASGIFNVRMGEPADEWSRYIRSTLALISAGSRRGFAVNLLSKTARARDNNPNLFLARVESWRDYCEKKFRVSIDVLSNYGLPEFTLLARHRPR